MITVSQLWKCCLALLVLCNCLPVEILGAEIPANQLEFFESRIRPVLVEHCYECHNSIDNAEGELALDFRQGMLDGGTSGPTLIPNNPETSQLLAVIRHEIPDLEMPEGGPKLSDEIIADFEKWISIGAPDPRDEPPTADELSAATSWQAILERRKQWWSLQPIQQPDIPESSTNPIDGFIQRKLTDHEIQPGNQADSFTLVRRLYFNLLGMPPSEKELLRWTEHLDSMSNTERKAAIAELIDHLLTSPHFGERWARHWMDWIRYAESHGSEGDPPIENAWMYRDYLIRALNADVPFDQLVREHIAGDLLDQPRINQQLGISESKIGTTHWRMVFHGFAPTDALEERVRFTDDQIDVFSKAFLGLTISCARCHDHKFDAVSQQDYYALYGILNSCRPARHTIDLPEIVSQQHKPLADLKPKIQAAIIEDWKATAADLSASILEIEKPSLLTGPLTEIRESIASGASFAEAWQDQLQKWQQANNDFREIKAANKTKWNLANKKDFEQWFSEGTGSANESQSAGAFSIATQGNTALIGIYPAGVYSHALSTKDSASLNSTYFPAYQGSELWVRVLGNGKASLRYVVQDYPRRGTNYPIVRLTNQWKWQRFDLSYWDGDLVHVELVTAQDAPLLVENEARSWFGVRQVVVRRQGDPAPAEINEYLEPIFAIAKNQFPQSVEDLAALYQSAIAAAISAWKQEKLTDQQALLLDTCLRDGLLPNQIDLLPTAKPLLEQYRNFESKISIPTRVAGLAETVARNQRLFDRGNHKNPAEEIPRRFLEVLSPNPYQTNLSGRLELAEDLLRDDNPLVRRVLVNRVWHHLFGQGIVNTPDNLGRLGSLPTHPELLDWLATHFKNEGWSLKKLIRLVVTSDTWQRTSLPTEKSKQLDPDNRLLSHMHVRRLEAEAVRDSLLTTSGQLNDQQFGKSVPGKQPRRSIYVQVIRNSLDPLLRVFDFPEPFSATGRRDATNVPAQSLTLMNDAGIIRYATNWAQQILRDQLLTDNAQRIQHMFLTAFGRRATSSEIEQAQVYLTQSLQHYQQLHSQITELENQQRNSIDQIQAILVPARQQLQSVKGVPSNTDIDTLPQPISHWELDTNLQDAVGSLNAQLKGGAKLTDHGLEVKGNAYAKTAPIEQDLHEKTLEAWVQLDNLNQRGGGVLSLQTIDGVYFDAIVFGEKEPQQWLAGSNIHARTQSFRAASETEAVERPVHVAITYHADGRITGYREGKPYGNPYQSNGPYRFQKGKAVLIMGLRHLPAGSNKGLAGKISRVRLYDRALSEKEIATSFRVNADIITGDDVLASLSNSDRLGYENLQAETKRLKLELASLDKLPGSSPQIAAWTDLARAIFMMKEFIYVR